MNNNVYLKLENVKKSFANFELDNVSDFKRGVVEERENRQEQRTQKRNLHREKDVYKRQPCA